MKSFARLQQGFLETTSIRTAVELLGRSVLGVLNQIGESVLFARSFFKWLVKKPYRWDLLYKQMEFIGVKSLPIILLTATFTGMVFALQTGYAFRLFQAEALVGSTVGLALTREIAPVFASLMVVARAGSAMAAEIGTMKVTEQVDALSSMAVNPVQYLVVPRVVAGTFMLPLLTALFVTVGLVGAYFVAVHIMGIPEAPFVNKLMYFVDADDFIGGLIKSAFFGFSLSLISCQRGFRTFGGAEGVGQSTTQAVVMSSVSILVINYFLSSLILEFLPQF